MGVLFILIPFPYFKGGFNLPIHKALTFSNVSFTKNEQQILNNINGSFFRGKITTLIGPSGAGKTTLLKLCNGLLSASSGTIFVGDINLNDFPATELRRNVGIALQNAPMLRATVFQNLQLPLTLQNKQLTEQQAIEALTMVQLPSTLLHKQVSELSGGQKQRLSIARTLLNKSSILLLDEITSALDPNSVAEIEELIIRINKDYNVTIIWITHNLEQAKSVGHYTWFMKNGELILADSTEAIFSSELVEVQQFIQGGHYI
jgi:putative ABC transport system ATP-binding protein